MSQQHSQHDIKYIDPFFRFFHIEHRHRDAIKKRVELIVRTLNDRKRAKKFIIGLMPKYIISVYPYKWYDDNKKNADNPQHVFVAKPQHENHHEIKLFFQ